MKHHPSTRSSAVAQRSSILKANGRPSRDAVAPDVQNVSDGGPKRAEISRSASCRVEVSHESHAKTPAVGTARATASSGDRPPRRKIVCKTQNGRSGAGRMIRADVGSAYWFGPLIRSFGSVLWFSPLVRPIGSAHWFGPLVRMRLPQRAPMRSSSPQGRAGAARPGSSPPARRRSSRHAFRGARRAATTMPVTPPARGPRRSRPRASGGRPRRPSGRRPTAPGRMRPPPPRPPC